MSRSERVHASAACGSGLFAQVYEVVMMKLKVMTLATLKVKLIAAVLSVLAMCSAADAAGRRQVVSRYQQQQSCTGSACAAQSAGVVPGVTLEPTPLASLPDVASGAVTVSSGFEVLAEVNAKRAARGLPPFVEDPNLTAAAQAAASYRARYRIEGHTNNDFGFLPAGVHADAGGCAAVEPSWGFLSCCQWDSYAFAGAASVPGADGKVYHHLFVRGGSAATKTVSTSKSVSRTGSGLWLFRRR